MFLQLSPTEVYIGFRDLSDVEPPTLMTFYNLETLEEDGTAYVIDVQPVDDQDIVAAFQNGLTDLGLLNWNVTPMLATLDRPINMTTMYDLVDDHEVKCFYTSKIFPSSQYLQGTLSLAMSSVVVMGALVGIAITCLPVLRSCAMS